MFLFLFHLGSSRNIDYNFGESFLNNFKQLFPLLQISTNIERMPNHGTLIDYLSIISPEDIADVRTEMMRRLLRQKILDKYRLINKYYLIAVDATQILKVSETEYKGDPEKYKHCLRKKINTDQNGVDHYQYYYNALEAKIVSPDGLALSIMTEFIENEDQDVGKQDCELKAFYRLAVKIKALFPRLNICLLFDSLYAGKPVFDVVKENNWESIIRFKDGKIPTVAKEFDDLKKIAKNNTGTCIVDANTRQEFVWINDIDYQNNKINLLECVETTKLKNEIKDTTFTWISSIRIDYNNYKQLSNKGGRCRWVIENQGFNAQKNEGYELEHGYSQNYNAIKCFYLFMQLAHCIEQLMIRGNSIKNIPQIFGSKKNLVKEFMFLFTRQIIDFQPLLTIINQPYQIRLNSS